MKHLGYEEFWCACCDGHVVDSKDATTGRFFSVAGELWSGPYEQDGGYEQVLFAVCAQCLKTDW